MLSKILHYIILSCNQATLLIEKKLHQSLSPSEERKLKIHLFTCKSCRKYHHKAYFLKKALQNLQQQDEKKSIFNSVDYERIKREIKEKIKK